MALGAKAITQTVYIGRSVLQRRGALPCGACASEPRQSGREVLLLSLVAAPSPWVRMSSTIERKRGATSIPHRERAAGPSYLSLDIGRARSGRVMWPIAQAASGARSPCRRAILWDGAVSSEYLERAKASDCYRGAVDLSLSLCFSQLPPHDRRRLISCSFSSLGSG